MRLFFLPTNRSCSTPRVESVRWPSGLLALATVFTCLQLIPNNALGQRPPDLAGLKTLPRTLGRLDRPHRRELEQLLEDAMGFLADKFPAPSIAPGNFFGKIVLTPPTIDAIDARPFEPGQFGYYVLGGLEAAQVRQLSDLARRQQTSEAAFHAKRKEVMGKLGELLKAPRVDRALERDLQKMGEELGALEAAMGLDQARTFLSINESMSKDQHEYLLLLRRSPDSGSLKNPRVAKIHEQAARLDPALRNEVLSMAERCCLFLTGSAAQNMPTLTDRQRTEQARQEMVQKLGVLGALNTIQQQGLANLLKNQVQMQSEARTRRSQVALLLETLKANKHVDDRKLAAPAEAMGRADVAAYRTRLQGLHQFRESLSNAQRVFIQNNVLAP